MLTKISRGKAHAVDPCLYLAIYSFTLFNSGLAVGSIGPIIPFLAQQRNKPETEYSILFTARTIGSVLGLIALRLIHRTYQAYEHKTIAASGIVIALMMLLFIRWQTPTGQLFSFFMIGAASYVMVSINSFCLLEVSGDKAGSWMPFAQGMFGVGALLSPLIVRFMGVSSYYAFAVFSVLMALLNASYPPPEHSQTSSCQSEGGEKRKEVSNNLVMYMGLAFFLEVGIQISASGWLPSYAVLTNTFDAQNAAVCGTLFWMMLTIVRFMIARSNRKISTNLSLLINGIVICSVIDFALHILGFYTAATLFGSIVFGMTCSGCYSLMMTLPVEFGLRLKSSQVSAITFLPAISLMLITAPVGILMSISMDMLFYCLVAISLILWVDVRMLFRIIGGEAQKIREKEGIELSQILIK